MQAIPYMALGAALAALGLAFIFYRYVRSTDPGNERMRQLMDAIAEGARTFLRREYRWVAVFVVLMVVLLVSVLDWGGFGAISYALGALLSAAAGWIGMKVATMANARTAHAARR